MGKDVTLNERLITKERPSCTLWSIDTNDDQIICIHQHKRIKRRDNLVIPSFSLKVLPTRTYKDITMSPFKLQKILSCTVCLRTIEQNKSRTYLNIYQHNEDLLSINQ